jgi:hypothetical protein
MFTIGKPSCFANLEVGFLVFNVMSLTRAERKEFEDRESMLLEIKKMLQSMYTWKVAWNSVHL